MKSNEFIIRKETILYTVTKCGERDIVGIPNVFINKSPMDYPYIEANAIEELVQSGYAEMDFYGKVKINSEYLAVIKACAKCREVAAVDIRTPDSIQHHITVYFVPENYGIITLRTTENTDVTCLRIFFK